MHLKSICPSRSDTRDEMIPSGSVGNVSLDVSASWETTLEASDTPRAEAGRHVKSHFASDS